MFLLSDFEWNNICEHGSIHNSRMIDLDIIFWFVCGHLLSDEINNVLSLVSIWLLKLFIIWTDVNNVFQVNFFYKRAQLYDIFFCPSVSNNVVCNYTYQKMLNQNCLYSFLFNILWTFYRFLSLLANFCKLLLLLSCWFPLVEKVQELE